MVVQKKAKTTKRKAPDVRLSLDRREPGRWWLDLGSSGGTLSDERAEALMAVAGDMLASNRVDMYIHLHPRPGQSAGR